MTAAPTTTTHTRAGSLAILALALGTFAVGTTEFVIIGLLPEVARGFDVSVPTAGLLVTGYALGVAFGAPFLTILGGRISRRQLLLGLMVIFIAGNLICATAGSYGILLAGRLVASLTHGAFFGVGAVVAADLVAPHKRAQAMGMMFAGLTVANVVGVPAGTALGDALGWRATFWATTILGVVALVALAILIPRLAKPPKPDLTAELAVLRSPRLLAALSTTTLVCASIFCCFTFIKPLLTDVAGFSTDSVSLLLVLFGFGVVAGNIAGSRLADRALLPAVYIGLTGLATTLALFILTAHAQIPAVATLVLVGFFGFAVFAPLQLRVIDQSHGAPALGSAMNIAAANLGNAAGAWIGGVTIDAGAGLTATCAVGAVLAVAAIASVVLARNVAPAPAVVPQPA